MKAQEALQWAFGIAYNEGKEVSRTPKMKRCSVELIRWATIYFLTIKRYI